MGDPRWEPAPRFKLPEEPGLDDPVSENYLSSLAKTMTAMMQFFDMFGVEGVEAAEEMDKVITYAREAERSPELIFRFAQGEFGRQFRDIVGKNMNVDDYGLNLGPVTTEALQDFVDVVAKAQALTNRLVREASQWSEFYHDFRKCASAWEKTFLTRMEEEKDLKKRAIILNVYSKYGLRPLDPAFLFTLLEGTE